MAAINKSENTSGDVLVLPGKTTTEIRKCIREVFSHFGALLPSNKDARIVLKPNLNSNMNALTGNTTDLRLIAVIIRELKTRGYGNITIAEGTNSGFYRQGINVIRRLYVDRLAELLDVKVKDTNYDDGVEIVLHSGEKAQIAKTFVEADFLINLPKIKMHWETEMSVALKSLVGTLIGMANKKKAHSNLIQNICILNEKIRPALHIVDGIIAMEGNGPTTGTPVALGVILAGRDPYRIDLAAARLTGCPFKAVPVLVESERLGKISEADKQYVEKLDIRNLERILKRPRVPAQTKLVTNKRLQKYFLKIRHGPGIRWFFNRPIGNRILFKLKLTQEVMIQANQGSYKIKWRSSSCKDCGICATFCPTEIDPKSGVQQIGCIDCLYCYCTCPSKAFQIEGDLGFFPEQLRQYDDLVRGYSRTMAGELERT